MFKSSSQRNPRSKCFKVKHGLQICVLLGICIWLVYQAEQYWEKKTSYSESTKTGSEVMKLGRKDLHPHVEQSSVTDARGKEEDEEKSEEHNKLGDANGVENEMLMKKREQNTETEDSSENIKSNKKSEEINQNFSEENDNKASEDNDGLMKENGGVKNEVEDKESREIGDEKSRQENEETREMNTENEENEEINQSKIEGKEHMEGNHEQDRNEKEEESYATKNDGEKNDKIREEVSSEDGAQGGEGNNEESREQNYAGDNVSSAVDFNKMEQSDIKEENDFELESQKSGTEVTHLDQNEPLLNVTESKLTGSAVTTTNQGNDSENQAKTNHDSRDNSIAEEDEQEKEHNTTSNTSENQLETSDNPDSKVQNSILHNTTMLEKEDSTSSIAGQQADSTLTDSSGAHDIIGGQDSSPGKETANDNGNDSHADAANTSDFSIPEQKDASSKDNNDAGQVENENSVTSEKEDGAQNESVESQKEKEGSTNSEF